MKTKSFNVVIAGGSVAGLALANMFEQAGIDYVLLEAYPGIAPQLGASIGLLPNGLRILDQLGCYPALRRLLPKPLKKTYFRGPQGQILASIDQVGMKIEERHGYPILFIDRQMLLQILYDNLRDKSKILVQKRVVKVSLTSSAVEVTTTDNNVFSGDILIGADGIHSAVRGEMWRIADEVQPGYIPSSEKTAMPTDYKCIFGISKSTRGIKDLTNHRVVNKHRSYLIITGPGSRIYWFLFVNIGKRHYGTDVPRYTKADEEKLAQDYSKDKITEITTFGELYANRTASVLTALPEYVFRKWYFRRIITIGDSAHKLGPLLGQGGNGAIESATVLVNNLIKALGQHQSPVSDDTISHVFEQTQKTRMDRACHHTEAAHEHQRLEAMETGVLEFVATRVVSFMNPDSLLAGISEAATSAPMLEHSNVPKRSHFVPYENELVRKPLKAKTLTMALAAAVFLILFCATATTRPSFSTGPLPTTFGSAAQLGNGTTSLVSASMIDKMIGLHLPTINVLAIQCTVYLTWLISSYRKGSSHTVLSKTWIFMILSRLFGMPKTATLYYLFSVLFANKSVATSTYGRPVPTNVARSLLPAILLGYVVPITLVFLPNTISQSLPGANTLWQLWPIYVGILTYCFSGILDRFLEPPKRKSRVYENTDVPLLHGVYYFAFCQSALAHSATSVPLLWRGSESMPQKILKTLWISNFSFTKPHDESFQLAPVVFAWCWYCIYQSRGHGFVKSRSAVRQAMIVTITGIVLGPGAACSATQYWLEGVLSGVSV